MYYFTLNTDVRGSVTSIVRPDGSLASGYVYDEFGNQIKTGELDFLNEATYTGAIYDSETELMYMNARYYDSSSGRFISQDSYKGSLSSPQTQHLYSYTSNNPINFIDPTGHMQRPIGPWVPPPPIVKPGNSSTKVNSKNAVNNAIKNIYNITEAIKISCSAVHKSQKDYLTSPDYCFNNKPIDPGTKPISVIKFFDNIVSIVGDYAKYGDNATQAFKAIGRYSDLINMVIGVGIDLYEGNSWGVSITHTGTGIILGAAVVAGAAAVATSALIPVLAGVIVSLGYNTVYDYNILGLKDGID